MNNMISTRYCLWATVVCLVFILSNLSRGCGLDWNVPENHFDGVNEHGDLSYWKTVGSLDLGGGLKVPLVINFNSSRNSISPYLGKGWLFPLLESNVVQIDPKRFLMVLPDGLTIHFKRRKEDTTLTGEGGGWMAQVTDNTITAWASCGWKLVFTNGKLSSITTPQNQNISFNYQNGVVKEIDENSSPLLTVISNSDSSISGFSFNEKQISVEQGRMPNVQSINGQNVIGEVQSSLGKITLADGSAENYKYSVGAGLIPTLDITGLDNRSFAWNPNTKLIQQDGDWTYNITPGATLLENAQIQRTNKAGQKEYWYYNKRLAQETVIDLNGNKTITQEFKNAGPLSRKVRSEKTFAPDGTLSQDEEYSYDENAKLIRKTENLIIIDDDGKRENLTELTNY